MKWFEVKTKGMTVLSKAELKKRWTHMQKGVSSEPRAKQIVNDILLDMETKPGLMDKRGNAMLVGSSIYQACEFYELFCRAKVRRSRWERVLSERSMSAYRMHSSP